MQIHWYSLHVLSGALLASTTMEPLPAKFCFTPFQFSQPATLTCRPIPSPGVRRRVGESLTACLLLSGVGYSVRHFSLPAVPHQIKYSWFGPPVRTRSFSLLSMPAIQFLIVYGKNLSTGLSVTFAALISLYLKLWAEYLPPVLPTLVSPPRTYLSADHYFQGRAGPTSTSILPICYTLY